MLANLLIGILLVGGGHDAHFGIYRAGVGTCGRAVEAPLTLNEGGMTTSCN